MKKLLVFVMIVCCSAAWGQGLIIDHTCTDITSVPPAFIDSAKAKFHCTYGHTSHGSQIVSGMEIMENNDDLYSFASDRNYYLYGSGSPVPEGVLSFWDYVPDGDLGAPDRVTWASLTDIMLSNSNGAYDIYPHQRNLVMWSWCGQTSWATVADIETYLSLMTELENEYPDVTFVYITGHLDGTGEEGNLNLRNEQIRQYCRDNNKVLFDFADIESYDPDGDYFLDLGATDGCDYSGGNWATQWCAEHPGDPLCETCSCAHSQSLNCNRKARAFWWMMARLAGWGSQLPPQNVALSFDGSNITLHWSAAAGAMSYQVLSSDNSESGFTEDITGTFDGTSWTTLLPASPDAARYYCVVAVY
jgi:hypothetical protein